MKIEIEPTGTFEKVNGTMCRIWKGKTDKGVEVVAYIPMVRVASADDNSAFEAELAEIEVARQPVIFETRFVVPD